MKIDRLLALVIFLMNREKVKAPELAEHFEVSVRTIQRDIDTLCAAGIPVLSMPGYGGGYGIMKHYCLNRQLVDTDDLFFMLTSLENVAGALDNRHIGNTLEKIRSLVKETQLNEINARRETLHIDFSVMKLGRVSDRYDQLEAAIRQHHLIAFQYTDGNGRQTERTVEPMTVVFQWTAWYLYGWCRLRSDYRLFRLSRMDDLEVLDSHFERRDQSFEACMAKERKKEAAAQPVVMRFHPDMGGHVMDHFSGADIQQEHDGHYTVKVAFPENGWLYNMLLSYGEFVEVLEPPHLRAVLRESCQKILEKYKNDKVT